MLAINEVFYSLQGEGLYQNEPTVFVRLAGCNLLLSKCCTFCDTPYAQDLGSGQEMSIEEVVKEVSRLQPFYKAWVCITGGEPLWQEQELEKLVRELKTGPYRITIETNGSIRPPRWYTLVDSWSADIKCPSSGVCGVSSEAWFNTRGTDQIKFVVANEEDLRFIEEVLSRHKTDNPVVLVSPVWGSSQEFLQKVWNFILEHKLRLSIQQHKVVFGEVKRGV